MVGKIKRTIEHIVNEKAKGNASLVNSVNAKICLKGVIPKKFTEDSPDDPIILEKLTVIAKEWDVNISRVI